MPPTLPTNDDAVNERHESEERYNSGSEPEPVSWTDPEDEHEMNLQGYQMLSPGGDEFVWINNEDDSEDDNDEPESLQQPIYATFENQSEEQEAPVFEVEMDSDHIEKIKNIMKNVTLPSSSMPSWSSAIPEDEWKSVLLQKLNSLTTDSSQKYTENTSGNLNLPSTSRTTVNSTNGTSCGKGSKIDKPDTDLTTSHSSKEH